MPGFEVWCQEYRRQPYKNTEQRQSVYKITACLEAHNGPNADYTIINADNNDLQYRLKIRHLLIMNNLLEYFLTALAGKK